MRQARKRGGKGSLEIFKGKTAKKTSASAGDVHKDMSGGFDVRNVRQALIQQEDSIIFSVIERAVFLANDAVYSPGSVHVPAYKHDGSHCSLLEFLLRETELVQGRVRRYSSPDEHQFFPEQQPLLALPPLVYDDVLHPLAKEININSLIYSEYTNDILPRVTLPGDDRNYGSTAHSDVLCLQAISKRVHFGKFVAEAKFAAEPEEYSRLASLAVAEDGLEDANCRWLHTANANVLHNPADTTSPAECAHEALLRKLTDSNVEQQVLRRVEKKAATFGQDIDSADDGVDSNVSRSSEHAAKKAMQYKVQPSVIASIFADWIMPLTKAVQIRYLKLKACGDGAFNGSAHHVATASGVEELIRR